MGLNYRRMEQLANGRSVKPQQEQSPTLLRLLSVDYCKSSLITAFSLKPPINIGLYTDLVRKAVAAGDSENVFELLTAGEAPDVVKASAVRGLSDLEPVNNIVIDLLKSKDVWARTFVLQKLCCWRSQKFHSYLVDLLSDASEVCDIGVSYRVSHLAALALFRQSPLPLELDARFQAWLNEQRPLLNSSLYRERMWSVLLFAELGDTQALAALRELTEQDTDPFCELSQHLARIERRQTLI